MAASVRFCQTAVWLSVRSCAIVWLKKYDSSALIAREERGTQMIATIKLALCFFTCCQYSRKVAAAVAFDVFLFVMPPYYSPPEVKML